MESFHRCGVNTEQTCITLELAHVRIPVDKAIHDVLASRVVIKNVHHIRNHIKILDAFDPTTENFGQLEKPETILPNKNTQM